MEINEISNHLLNDKKPSDYFNSLSESAFENSPFSLLKKLKKVKQSPQYHAEGDVWIHTMLVVDEAAKRKQESSNAKAFMWAALLHDIGKIETTKFRNGRITAYDHDKAGAAKAKEFLEYIKMDDALIRKIVPLIRWHMQILYVAKNLPFAEIEQMKQEVSVNDIALLSLCDRLGRANVDTMQEKKTVQLFLEKML